MLCYSSSDLCLFFLVSLLIGGGVNPYASILSALVFSLDMFSKTAIDLLLSVLGSVVFSIFSAQPLTIGVTGEFFRQLSVTQVDP